MAFALPPVATITAVISAVEAAQPIIDQILKDLLPLLDKAAHALDSAIPGAHAETLVQKLEQLQAAVQPLQAGLPGLQTIPTLIQQLQTAIAPHLAA